MQGSLTLRAAALRGEDRKRLQATRSRGRVTRFSIGANEPDLAEEEAELDAAQQLLLEQGGNSTRAGAAALIAEAGGMAVAPKALEIASALAELDVLGSEEVRGGQQPCGAPRR